MTQWITLEHIEDITHVTHEKKSLIIFSIDVTEILEHFSRSRMMGSDDDLYVYNIP